LPHIKILFFTIKWNSWLVVRFVSFFFALFYILFCFSFSSCFLSSSYFKASIRYFFSCFLDIIFFSINILFLQKSFFFLLSKKVSNNFNHVQESFFFGWYLIFSFLRRKGKRFFCSSNYGCDYFWYFFWVGKNTFFSFKAETIHPFLQ